MLLFSERNTPKLFTIRVAILLIIKHVSKEWLGPVIVPIFLLVP